MNDEYVGIKIGAADEASINAVTNAIMQILASGQEQKTLRLALKALTQSTNVSNSMVSGCTIMNGPTKDDED